MKIIVIGSGIGGAACAALLVRKGHEVTILERNSFPGGKSRSYEKEGFICDMGIHYSGRGEKGPHGEVNRRINGNLRWITDDPLCKLMIGEDFIYFPLDLKPLRTRYKLSRFLGVKAFKLPGVLRALNHLTFAKEEKDVEPYDSTSLKEYLLRYTDDKALHRLISIICGVFMVIPPVLASAGEFIWCFSTWMRDASCSYPKGGFREISLSFLRAMERDGGKVEYGAEAKKIVLKKGNVKGVEVKGKFFETDVVVSNAGIKRTIELVGRQAFEPTYVKKAFSLRDSYGAVSIRYALDRKVLNIPIVLQFGPQSDPERDLLDMENGRVPEDPPLFITVPSHVDPGLAPPGCQIFIAGAAVPSNRSKSQLADKVLEKVDQKVKRLFPEIKGHIIWQDRANLETISRMSGRGAGEVIGLAQTYDQCGKDKPNPRMPVEGLYLVGCDAGGRGIGTEQASDSALKVSEMIG